MSKTPSQPSITSIIYVIGVGLYKLVH